MRASFSMTARDVARGLNQSRAIVVCSAHTGRCHVRLYKPDAAATSVPRRRHTSFSNRNVGALVTFTIDHIFLLHDGRLENGASVGVKPESATVS